MRSVHYFISLLFVIFAVVQWNDPDPYLWILLYLLVALVPVLYLKQKLNKIVLRGFLIVLFLLSASYIPELVSWMQEGMPTITSTMKASSPYIETIRESLGLFLSFLVLLPYYFKVK